MTLTKQSTQAVSAVLLCLALGLVPAQAAAAQSAALIRLVAGAATVGAGATTAVEVRVENVADLYGLDIRISYNPAAVEVVDADSSSEGVQIRPGGLLAPDFVVRNQADNNAGTVWFALTQLHPSEAVTGSGVAFIVTFRGRAACASSPLTFSYFKLASRAGDLIPASAEDGEIRVVAAEQAPPTPTAAPSLPPPTLVVPTAPPPTLAPTLTTPAATVAVTAAPAPVTATAGPVATTVPSATSVPPVATAPAATSAAPLLQATGTTAPTTAPVTTATRAPSAGAGSSLWLIVYGLLFAVAFAAVVIGARIRRNRQQ